MNTTNFLTVIQARALRDSFVRPVETLEETLKAAFDEILIAASEGRSKVNLTNKNYSSEVKKFLKGNGFSVGIFKEDDGYMLVVKRIEVSW